MRAKRGITLAKMVVLALEYQSLFCFDTDKLLDMVRRLDRTNFKNLATFASWEQENNSKE